MSDIFNGSLDQNLYQAFKEMPKVKVLALTTAAGSLNVGETITKLHGVIQFVNGVYNANGVTGAEVDGTTASQVNFDAPVTAGSQAVVLYN